MVKVFLHIATMGEYQRIGNELINEIVSSGLLSNCDELNISIVGDGEFNHPYEDVKIKKYRTGQINEYEFPTLQMIEDAINDSNENIKILYLNSLGVTDDSIYKKSWRSYLTYFNVVKFNECIKSLDNGYDVCGVDWRTDPIPHYSGNFWWANSNYLKTLPKIIQINNNSSNKVLTLRHNAEMYIGMNNNVTPRVLHQSNVSQYYRHIFTYDKSNYLDRISENDEIRPT